MMAFRCLDHGSYCVVFGPAMIIRGVLEIDTTGYRRRSEWLDLLNWMRGSDAL
jgi:hypothetical protein